jgi:hypothetical protein
MLSKKQVLRVEADTALVPLLIGKTGEGKTQYVKEIAAENGLSLCILNLSACEAVDLLGIPTVIDGRTIWARPAFLDADLLFLDEIDRVRDTSVRSALLSLLDQRKLNGHEFQGKVVAAGNGKTGINETIEFDDAGNERFVFIDFSFSIHEKVSYLKAKFPQSNFIKYCEVRPEIFDRFSARRIEKAARISDDIEILKAVLNAETSSHYEMYVQQNLVTLSDIMKGESYDRATSLTRLTISYEVVSSLKSLLKASEIELTYIASFIRSMAAEEKSLYFTKLKDSLVRGLIDLETLTSLNSKGLFAGQKEYLKEVI